MTIQDVNTPMLLNEIEENLVEMQRRRASYQLKEVLVDMDGVLVDFVSGVCRLFDRDPIKIKAEWPIGEYNLGAGFKDDPNTGDIWKAIERQEPHFWTGLNIEPDAVKVLNTIQHCRTSVRTWVVTQPKSAQSMLGKKRWIEHNIGKEFNRYIFTPHKEVLASRFRLLIDDCEENCKRFIAAGGQAFLWPRPWNSAWAETTGKWDKLELKLLR